MTDSFSENAVLNGLFRMATDLVSERLLTRPINAGEVLFEPGAPLIHVIFPHTGIISLQAVLEDGRTIEKALIGREEFVGFEYVLGERHFAYHGAVVLSGRASWLSISEFEAALARHEDIRLAIHRSGLVLFRSLMQSVVCASHHSASQRLATWLLRVDDRSHDSHFELTQRTLASILGLRLATIGDACAKLHAANAIEQGRASLTIVDRRSLELLACECYQSWPSFSQNGPKAPLPGGR